MGISREWGRKEHYKECIGVRQEIGVEGKTRKGWRDDVQEVLDCRDLGVQEGEGCV